MESPTVTSLMTHTRPSSASASAVTSPVITTPTTTATTITPGAAPDTTPGLSRNKALPSRSRAASLSSDMPTNSTQTQSSGSSSHMTMAATMGGGWWLQASTVNPEAAFVGSAAASQIVATDHEVQAGRWSTEQNHPDAGVEDHLDIPSEAPHVAEAALVLVNGFIDQLLYEILAAARSTLLPALRPAVAKVLKPNLAKDAIALADEELCEYLGTSSIDDFTNGVREDAINVDWDLGLVWRQTRLRCMVYSSLGDMEEEDEDFYLAQEQLDDVDRFSDLVSPETAIFLTAILEHIAEHVLIIAGRAAFQRVRSMKLSHKNTILKDASRRSSGSPERIVVQEADVERVALDRTLGRLWRGWKKKLRCATHENGHGRAFSRDSARQAASGGAISRVESLDISNEPPSFANNPHQADDEEDENGDIATKLRKHRRHNRSAINEWVRASEAHPPLPLRETNQADDKSGSGTAEDVIDRYSSLPHRKSLVPLATVGKDQIMPTLIRVSRRRSLSTTDVPFINTSTNQVGAANKKFPTTPPSTVGKNWRANSADAAIDEGIVTTAKSRRSDDRLAWGNSSEGVTQVPEFVQASRVPVRYTRTLSNPLLSTSSSLPPLCLPQHGYPSPMPPPPESPATAAMAIRQKIPQAIDTTLWRRSSTSIHSARIVEVSTPRSSKPRPPLDSRRPSTVESTTTTSVYNSAPSTASGREFFDSQVHDPLRRVHIQQQQQQQQQESAGTDETPPQTAASLKRYTLSPRGSPTTTKGRLPESPTAPKPVLPRGMQTPAAESTSSLHQRCNVLPSVPEQQHQQEQDGITTSVKRSESQGQSSQGSDMRRSSPAPDFVRVHPTSAIVPDNYHKDPSLHNNNIAADGSVAQNTTNDLQTGVGPSKFRLRLSEEQTRPLVLRPFEDLMKSNDTIQCTLTPENVRHVDPPANPPDIVTFPPSRFEDRRRNGRSRSSSFRSHDGSVSIGADKRSILSLRVPSEHPLQGPAQINGTPPPTGTGAGASVVSAVTSITGRSGTPQARNARSRDSMIEFSRWISGTRSDGFVHPMQTRSETPGPLSSVRSLNKLVARGATMQNDNSTGDLIDFIRRGPPSLDSHVPRVVAPFNHEQATAVPAGELAELNNLSSVVSEVTTYSGRFQRPGVNDPSIARDTETAHGPSVASSSSTSVHLHARGKGPRDPYNLDFSDIENDSDDNSNGNVVRSPPRREESLAEFLLNYKPSSAAATTATTKATSLPSSNGSGGGVAALLARKRGTSEKNAVSSSSGDPSRKRPSGPSLMSRLMRSHHGHSNSNNNNSHGYSGGVSGIGVGSGARDSMASNESGVHLLSAAAGPYMRSESCAATISSNLSSGGGSIGGARRGHIPIQVSIPSGATNPYGVTDASAKTDTTAPSNAASFRVNRTAGVSEPIGSGVKTRKFEPREAATVISPHTSDLVDFLNNSAPPEPAPLPPRSSGSNISKTKAGRRIMRF